ncbi:peptide/nickel transport system ATP-binding protein [Loktanella fryxellensis]|uniref:Peptide/nickel transport system ATP-binding protein n=1 Tax=Loktanella fryxellensis TaxID=245187 RepID=A0A1H8CE10_9RHOB|nr:ABC transporter ATP-binding protein [Loktanella fryxellensis]SEM93139.1 peptide/nickel transport system ATP-binding protein [Loktanella fryxellensis]
MTDPAQPTGAAAAPVLSVQGLCVSVRTDAGLVPLVSDISFDLARGETLAIAGESGSGKSITSLAIMGLLPPPAVRVTGGEIRLGDTVLTTLPESRMRGLRGDRIAMIFQEPMTSLNPVMTVGAQLVEAIRAHAPLSRRAAQAEALAALTAVRLSEPARRMGQYPHELSGGMRQRVMIAMALALKPDVLIADEPTTALDVTVQREVLDLLRDLQRTHGTAILLITHDMGVVAEMADRVIVMRRGMVQEMGQVRQIFAAPKAAYTRDLLAAVPRMGQGGDAVPRSTAPVVAQLTDVQVRYDLRGGVLNRVTHRVHAVEGVSFDIRAGETFSLVGESGCGKSTIARAMVGLTPHQGTIRIADQAVGTMTAQSRKSLSAVAQIVFQDPMAALDPRMTVGDQIAEPLLIHGQGNRATRRARAADLMDRVGLTAAQLDNYPHEFSGGQRQRICIARALALTPKLIVADESVSALDVSVQARVLDLLRALKDEFAIAMLFISHDMAVVENISDRVGVMHLGQIVEIGSRAQIFGNPQHPYTRRLMAAVPVADPAAVRPVIPRMAGNSPNPVHKVGAVVPRHRLVAVADGHLVAQAG